MSLSEFQIAVMQLFENLTDEDRSKATASMFIGLGIVLIKENGISSYRTLANEVEVHEKEFGSGNG